MDWIVEKILQKLKYRVIITGLILTIVAIYFQRHPLPAAPLDEPEQSLHIEQAAYLYQNIWLYSGFAVSFAIMGFLVLYIFIKSLDQKVPKLRTPAVLALAITLGLSIILSVGLGYIHSHPLTFHLIALVITILIYIMDLCFKNTEYFPNLDEAWEFVRTFDLSIIAGTTGTVILCHIVEKSQGSLLSSGFAGGAIAFQLIVANLVFDPALYRIQGHSFYKR